MKTLNVMKVAMGSLMICLIALSTRGNAFIGNDKENPNTPTHTVKIADITRENEMPREMRSGRTTEEGINNLAVSAFNLDAVKDGKYSLAFNLAKNGTTFVRIVDNAGYDVYFETYKDGQTYNKQIDLSTLPAGTYFFQVTQKGKTYSKKLIFS